jgi:hypothetical protein
VLEQNDFTNRNTTFATWNLLHMPRMLKDAGDIPARQRALGMGRRRASGAADRARLRSTGRDERFGHTRRRFSSLPSV